MLFATGRYPSTMGAGGQQDVEFCRYIEWVWFKRCVWLLGIGLAFGGVGLYVGYYYEPDKCIDLLIDFEWMFFV